LATCKEEEDRPPDDPAAEAHEAGPGPRLPEEERGHAVITPGAERGGGVAGTAAAARAAKTYIYSHFHI